VPNPERIILPVFPPPRVRACLAVVAKFPVAVKYAPPAVPAETEAVGVPLTTFMKANFADEVDVPPINKSFVELFG